MNAVIVGAAGAGGLIGLLISLSATPVVATFLPLLLSLFGGAGGFFAFKVNFAKKNTIKQLNLFGWSLASFAVAAIIGVFVGISTKHFFYAQQPQVRAVVPDATSQADLIRKLAMRKRLDGLGATRSEIEKFFGYRYDPTAFSEKLVELNGSVASVVSTYEKAQPTTTTNLNPLNPLLLFSQLIDLCKRFQTIVAAVDPQIRDKSIPIELAELLTADLRSYDFATLIRSKSGVPANVLGEEMMKAVTKLYADVLQARFNLPLQNSDKEVEEADKLWVTGQPTPQQLPSPGFIPTVAELRRQQMWN